MGDNGGPSVALTPERGSTTSGAEHDEVASTAKTDTRSHHSESHDVAQPGEDATESDGGTPPPLPPRPKPAHSTTESPSSPSNTLRVSSLSSRPQLRTTATTALSLTDIQTQTYQDGARETYPISSQAASGTSRGYASPGSISHGRIFGHSASEMGETSSLRSYVPTLEATGDVESLMGEALGTGATGPAWNLVGGPDRTRDQFEDSDGDDSDQDFREKFHHEFDGVQQRTEDENDEEAQLQQWRSRLKHFLILSSAGKPIYSRHGDQKLISSYMGVVQTIISFYQGAQDPLRAFSAGGVRFVILTEGPLYLVAISRLDESDTQLRVQLEALYMQVLSTLTLPVLTNLFSNRPSTDLRRPLQGTEPLLSALADSFTKGSPSTLLSALECLKLRKAHRQRINQALLNARTPDLLYGLLVAGGRLVSVVRPKRHSLHPGDLQLIFNMLFAAGGVKAGGGENWIPLCLPGFNKDGYLYMYVGFLGDNQDEGKGEEKTTLSSSSLEKEDHVAILLISPKKEGFYEMKKMRDQVVGNMTREGSMALIRTAVLRGRPSTTDILPGTVIRHYLYKSRANVQFTMPSYSPHFSTVLARRKLMTTYATLHATTHARSAHLKINQSTTTSSVALGWTTPTFELYAVAGPNATRAALARGAEGLVRKIRMEEERLFILGGAVF